MAGERLTRYTQNRLRISSVLPTPFVILETHLFLGEEFVEKERRIHENHNAELATIHIEDEASQNSLFAQAVSAVNNYPKERRERHIDFNPFVYVTEPGGSRFLIGDLKGTWDLANDSFELRSILIHHVCDTKTEMQKLMWDIQSLNPGVPKIASDSFEKAFEEETAQASL